VDGTDIELLPGRAVVIEKGRARGIVAGPAGIRYLTAHRARGGLRIERVERPD
jgi:hypothetical protein